MNEKIALVTGASRGFGAAVAEELAADGWHVVALAQTVGGLEDLDDRIATRGGAVTLVPLDITDEEGLKRMCLSIFERWGRIDLLLHAAMYVAPLTPAGHVPPDDLDKMLAVGIRSTQRMINMTESLLLEAKNGIAILPTDDVAGTKFLAGYGAVKAAQQAIWDSWAKETVVIGPKVMTFAPKPMPTALRGRFYPGEDRDQLARPKDEARRMIKALAL